MGILANDAFLREKVDAGISVFRNDDDLRAQLRCEMGGYGIDGDHKPCLLQSGTKLVPLELIAQIFPPTRLLDDFLDTGIFSFPLSREHNRDFFLCVHHNYFLLFYDILAELLECFEKATLAFLKASVNRKVHFGKGLVNMSHLALMV